MRKIVLYAAYTPIVTPYRKPIGQRFSTILRSRTPRPIIIALYGPQNVNFSYIFTQHRQIPNKFNLDKFVKIN